MTHDVVQGLQVRGSPPGAGLVEVGLDPPLHPTQAELESGTAELAAPKGGVIRGVAEELLKRIVALVVVQARPLRAADRVGGGHSAQGQDEYHEDARCEERHYQGLSLKRDAPSTRSPGLRLATSTSSTDQSSMISVA